MERNDPFQAFVVLPQVIEYWLVTTLVERFVKIRALVVGDVWYGTFQMAEVAVLRDRFRNIFG